MPARQRRGPGPVGPRDPCPAGRQRTVDLALRLSRGAAPTSGSRRTGGPGLDRGHQRGAPHCGTSCDLPFTLRPPRLYGPVTALANLHLATSQPNSLGVEVVRGFIDGYYREVLDAPLSIDHGQLLAPARPGLGAALSADFLRRDDVKVVRSK